MECHCIKQTSIPHSTRLFTEYLYHFDRVRPFYSFDPFAGQSFFHAADSIRYPAETRAAVAGVLERQAERFGSGEAARRNLQRFRNGAVALVTGQQVGLFTGPVFACYKALTAVRLADWLTSKGLDCVPVFWLATEDHDLYEINHAFVLDRDYILHRIEDPGAPHALNAPVGTVPLSANMAPETERLLGLLRLPPGGALAASIRSACAPGVSFGDSFGRFMASVLDRFGVILMDPADAEYRRLSAGVFRTAIQSADDLRSALAERNKDLTRLGFHVQVHVGDQSTLFFMNHEGARTPVRRRNGDFFMGDERRSEQELLDQLERAPQDFSPNVLLRPIVQDVLLPTVAYVGGPAELAYMAQASLLYHRLAGRMPVMFPRASFTLLDERAEALLKRYGLTVLEVLAGPQSLRDKMAPHFLPERLSAGFSDYERRLQEVLNDLHARMEAFDHTLADAAATSARKITYQLQKIKRKAGRAAGLKSGSLEADAQLLENLIHPRKNLQERVYSGLSFLAMFGERFLEGIYDRISLQCGDHQVLTL